MYELWGLKWISYKNFETIIYLRHFFHFDSPSFDFILSQQIWLNYSLIWSKKDAIVQNKSLRIKIKKKLKKVEQWVHSKMWQSEQCMYSKNTTSFNVFYN
jgi:hypothetical protein